MTPPDCPYCAVPTKLNRKRTQWICQQCFTPIPREHQRTWDAPGRDKLWKDAREA